MVSEKDSNNRSLGRGRAKGGSNKNVAVYVFKFSASQTKGRRLRRAGTRREVKGKHLDRQLNLQEGATSERPG